MTSAALTNVEDVFPMTPMQQGMVYHSMADDGSGVYVNQIVTSIDGTLDVPALVGAWEDVVTRHATLRTAFLWDGLDDPLQVVRQTVTMEWLHVDLTTSSEAEALIEVTRLLNEDRERGFDLSDAPLSRMMMIRTGEDRWIWVWSFHHLAADGWSAQILIDEAFARYRAGAEPVELPPAFPYRTYVDHVRNIDESTQERFWREQLSGFTEPHTLEVPGLPPVASDSGYDAHTITIGSALAKEVGEVARSHNVTLNTVFVGMWSLIVGRWQRTNDVVFGATVSGRPGAIEGIERATGLFINTIPRRIDTTSSIRLGPFLGSVQRSQLAAQDYEHSSLAAIQRWSDIPPGEPLFESVLVFENYPTSSGRSLGEHLRIGDADHIEQSNYPLAVLVIPGTDLRVSFVFDKARFSLEAIEGLGEQVVSLLKGIASNPDGRLSSFALTDTDAADQRAGFETGPVAVHDRRTMHDIISEVSARTPSATAVVFEDESLTYGELETRAHDVAVRIADSGVERGQPVGLLVPRSIEMVVGIVGILKAGAAYVPLDPEYPDAHIAALLRGDAIETVLTTAALAPAVPESVATLMIDDDRPRSQNTPLPATTTDDLAYIIHTSGSTGTPKGVMVTHGNLVASTGAREQHYGHPVTSFLLLSSFAFDSSVAGIFWTLTSGGTLVIPRIRLEQDVGSLLALIREQQVTHTLCLPSLYQVLLEYMEDAEHSSLEVVIVAGEVCPPGVVAAHRERLPHTQLHNEYGPTEATVWCTAHMAEGSDEDRALPIGRPIAGTTVHVLDRHGNRVPLGFAGEICVGGMGVTPGYLRRPDLTAESFVTIPIDGRNVRIYRTGDLAAFQSDGTLIFLGRTDQQLKIRGHRIETGAVEAALRRHPSVEEAVAVGVARSERSGKQLVAYVRQGASDDEDVDLIAELGASLPEFMVPDVVVSVSEIPRLPNGKVDTRALPDPEQRSGGKHFVAPRTEDERRLAQIWSDLLGVDAVGVRDDFFALGGDSIISIRMISRARQAGIYIEPGRITTYPTVEALAASSVSTVGAPADVGPVTGQIPLGPVQAWFFELGLPHPEQWNQSIAIDLPVDADPAVLEAALLVCVEHHDMLRARFDLGEGGVRQVIRPEADLPFESVVIDTADTSRVAQDLQAGLDLHGGPLLRAAHVTTPDTQLLIIAAHHLVTDVVSWSILTEDLEAAYSEIVKERPAALPTRTTPFRDWATMLESEAHADERAFWISQLPTDGSTALRTGTERSRSSVEMTLDDETTRMFLTSANDAYATRSEDLLVASLARALASVDAAPAVSIALEGHGRDAHVGGVDLSRTVGWFTAQYPVSIPVTDQDHEAMVKGTKEALRGVPDSGRGYGVLRYVHRDEELRRQREPSYLFNYLGRADTGSPAGRFGAKTWVHDAARHPDNPRTHVFEIVASVTEDRLTVEWHFSDETHDRREVERLAQIHLDQLRSLITHCTTEGSGGFTPSDFPEAGLDQDQLDDFLDGLL